MSAHRSKSFPRLRFAGAVIALLGFLSQYPIPALHRCPVMNPAAHAGEQEAHGHEHEQAAVVPPCHRRLAEVGHKHHEETEADGDGHHSHDSCPVCQGYLQLLTLAQSLPAPLLRISLQPMFVPVPGEGVRVHAGDLRLPDCRGPPAFS